MIQPSSLLPLTRQILVGRGYRTEAEQLNFLNPDYAGTDYNPYLLPGMSAAVERLALARHNHERVIIYGDYDVDGVTATTLLLDALPKFGLDVGYFVPDRFRDGYGMNNRAIKELNDGGADLILTVDNGIVASDVANYAAGLGLDLIITDHHEPRKDLPHACAVVDPKILALDHPLMYDRHFVQIVKDADKYPFLDLCGCGVAFKLVRALQQRFPDDLPEGQEKWLLDLVALATICDMVSLVDENRALAKWGLVVLRQTKRPGLRALMAAAGVDASRVDSEAVGFTLGPRINAAGRLANASLAVDLLSTSDPNTATTLAEKLNKLNSQRKGLQNQIADEALEKCDPDLPVTVVAGNNWHQGVIGIAASKVERTTKKPSFVGSIDRDKGLVKLSGRSFGDFSIAKAITRTRDMLVAGGGHAAAGGVTVKLDDLAKWRDALADYYASLKLDATEQLKYLFSQPDVVLKDVGELTLGFVRQLSLLEPFGTANPSVTVELKDFLVQGKRLMGQDGQHVRYSLVPSGEGAEGDFSVASGTFVPSLAPIGSSTQPLAAVAFNADAETLSYTPGDQATFLLSPTINEWHGNESVEGIIERIQN